MMWSIKVDYFLVVANTAFAAANFAHHNYFVAGLCVIGVLFGIDTIHKKYKLMEQVNETLPPNKK